jgi:TetR/AcrR family transcriptional regulator, transcriptional repressor for nem operon
MKEDTRQKLIDITYEEVFTHGYQGASLAEILKKAGVHKGSMYHYFTNKKQMALSAINEKIHERFFERYNYILEQKKDFIETFIKGLKDTSKRDFKRGCPIANVVQEMSNIDEEFNITMQAIYSKFRKYFKTILDKAIEAQEIKKCDTTKIALYISAVLEGAILAAKASGNPQDYLDTIEMLEEYLVGLKI